MDHVQIKQAYDEYLRRKQNNNNHNESDLYNQQ